ncbi:putative collagen-binding domain-containing protein, partial [Candidatus Poribacteria bacterium]
QLGILKEIFLARDEWWELVPDQALFAEGGCIEGTVLNLAARHRDGRWAMAYLADPASVSVRLDKLASSADALWIDPRTGESQAAGSFANTGVASFTTPDGWEDALLVLSALAER